MEENEEDDANSSSTSFKEYLAKVQIHIVFNSKGNNFLNHWSKHTNGVQNDDVWKDLDHPMFSF